MNKKVLVASLFLLAAPVCAKAPQTPEEKLAYMINNGLKDKIVQKMDEEFCDLGGIRAFRMLFEVKLKEYETAQDQKKQKALNSLKLELTILANKYENDIATAIKVATRKYNAAKDNASAKRNLEEVQAEQFKYLALKAQYATLTQ